MAKVFFLFVFFIPVVGWAVEKTAPVELSGELIDQLMRKEAGETPSPLVVADTSLVKNQIGEINSATTKKAEESEPVFKKAPASKVAEAESSPLWTRVLLSLVIALSLFGASVYVFKKWPGSKKFISKPRLIEMVAQHSLGARRSVAVIKVAGESVLVGVTDHNITILKHLTLLDEEIPSRFQALLNEDAAPSKQDETEEFSVKGIRDFSSRSKTLREY